MALLLNGCIPLCAFSRYFLVSGVSFLRHTHAAFLVKVDPQIDHTSYFVTYGLSIAT